MRILSALPVLLAVIVHAVPVAAGALTAAERQRLVAHLEMTEHWLSTEVAGLTTSQLTFRPSPNSWSINDVVEHLAIAEPQYWQQVQASLKAPITPGYKPDATDAGILWYGIDRTERTRTGDARVPDGRFKSMAEALASFTSLRAAMLTLARESQDDFRGRKLIEGNMDVYQWFLMISTHAQRHILQIQEIKGDKGYPKG
jgi:hypothetical protein